MEKLKGHTEPNRTVRLIERIALILLLAGFLVSFFTAVVKTGSDPGTITSLDPVEMTREESLEEFDEDSTVCTLVYTDGEEELHIDRSCDEIDNNAAETVVAYGFETKDGTRIFFDHPDPSLTELKEAYREVLTDRTMAL
ncbi:MAG: hypothetical protein IIZ47_05590, partial [Erysipelotrichaceae bacterium]|nr:hypothetical protein [Erysipelotrichaceae bacterium]